MLPRRISSLVCLLLVGCEAQIFAPESEDPTVSGKPPVVVVKPSAKLAPPVKTACTDDVMPGPSPIRRMTRTEYDRTVNDLLGDDTHPAAEFNAEEEGLGFNNNAMALTTTSALVEKHMSASERISLRVTSRLGTLPWYSCGAPLSDDACAAKFIDAFGLRVFRRPLDEDTRAMLQVAYTQGKALGSIDAANVTQPAFIAGLRLVIEAALQAPDFLYRVEVSSAPVLDRRLPPGLAKLDDHEVAARLSYMLWGSMPDEALFLAASNGELRTKQQVAAQAERMLEVAQARAQVVEFHRQWLDFDRIHNVGKSATVFPTWTPAIAGLMEKESEAFIEQVVFDGDGSWESLMSAPYSMLNPALAAFYNVTAATTGSGYQKVAFDPLHRAGLLTQGTLLAINAHTNQTSPVHRGKLVREAFLCEVLDAPPPEVNITVPEPKADSTARERFAAHSASNSCKGCHRMMDPLGFGLENLDGVGVYREKEAGRVIDDSGEVFGTDVPGTFKGVRGLATKLTSSKQAQRCYVKQWFRFAYGRGELAEDACSIERVNDAFTHDRHDIKKLVLALTQTDAFLYRRTGVAP